MQMSLLPAAIIDRATLANLLQLYLYDLSDMIQRDVDEHGCFSYPELDLYWSEPDRYPFFIRVDERLAGFVLVNRVSRISDPFNGHTIAEFFVLRKYRVAGVGRAAAVQLFRQFPGRWEVAIFALNVPGQAFWRSVIDQYTGGRYQERWLQSANWRGCVESFVTSV